MGSVNCCFYKKKDYTLFTDGVYDPSDENIVYDKMLGQDSDEVVISLHNNNPLHLSSTENANGSTKWYNFGTHKRTPRVSFVNINPNTSTTYGAPITHDDGVFSL